MYGELLLFSEQLAPLPPWISKQQALIIKGNRPTQMRIRIMAMCKFGEKKETAHAHPKCSQEQSRNKLKEA